MKDRLKKVGIIFTLVIMVFTFYVNKSSAQQQGQISINAIKMNDFYKTAISRSEDGTITLSKDANYDIVFYPKYKNEFLIILNSDTFNQYRAKAENNLVEILGIPKYQVCWLNSVVSSPANVELKIDSKSERPSFCLGASHANQNGDSSVNALDLTICLKQYGQTTSLLSCDLDYSHKVNATDLSEVIKYLGQSVK